MHHLSFRRVLAYAAGKLGYEETIKAEEHLAVCAECASKVHAHFQIREHFDEIWGEVMESQSATLPDISYEADSGRRILEKLINAVETGSDHARQAFETMRLRIHEIMAETFAFPTPAFAPVFGKSRVTVVGPVGKVRHPIVFEWEPVPEADTYIVAINDAHWEKTTRSTRILVECEELPLEHGQEYDWVFKAAREGRIIEKSRCFFKMADRWDIEAIEVVEFHLQTIAPKKERMLLLAGVLESFNLYDEAARLYRNVFAMSPKPGVAYRIASCYHQLELEELKDRWNMEVLRLKELPVG